MPYIKGSKKDLEKDYTSLITERLKHERAKFEFYDNWYLNYATFRANLFSGMPSTGIELWRTLPLHRATQVERKLQPIINRITPIVEYYVGHLSQNIFPRIVPEHYTDRARRHAMVKEEGLEYFYRECGLAEKQNLASQLRVVMGDGAFKVVWDDGLKPNCQCYEKWLIEKEAMLQEIEQGGDIEMSSDDMEYFEEFDDETHCSCRGMPAIDVLTNWDWIPNQEATSMEKLQWWIHRYRFNRDRAEKHFNESKEAPEGIYLRNGEKLEITTSEPNNDTPFVQRAISPLYNIEFADLDTECFIEECYEKPTPDFPKGRLIITGNEGRVLLYAGPLPWNRYNQLNIFKLGFKQNAGTIWSDSLISKVVPTQNEINDLFGRVKDIMRKFALIKLVTAQQHNIKGDVTTDPSDKLEYNPLALGGASVPPPHYLTLPSPPQFSGDILQWMTKEIEVLSGYFEMQKGTIPSEVKSGVMFDRAMEQSNKKLKPVSDRDILTYGKMYPFLLSLIEEKMDPSWWEKFTGRGKAKHVYSYDKDFKETTFDVHVEPMSVYQMSAASQSEFLMSIMDRGAFQDRPELLFKALKLLGWGGLHELMEQEEADEGNAREENIRWLKTGQINDWKNMPVPYENYNAHMEEHVEFMKTPEFMALPQEQRMQFVNHVNQTKEEIDKIQMEMAKRQQEMMANQGSPPRQRPMASQPAPGPQ